MLFQQVPMPLIFSACFLFVTLLMRTLSHESNLTKEWQVHYLLEIINRTIGPACPLVNLL